MADDDLDALDLEDLERAKGEGMGTAITSDPDPLHVPSDNDLLGVMAEPVATGEHNGMGLASSDRYSS